MGRIESVKRKGRTKDAVIESKDQRWHCRNRITLVFGSNDIEDLETYTYGEHEVNFGTVKFHQAKSKAIEELLDNCIDEFYRGHVTEVHTYLSDDGKTITVEDNGIGFPLPKIPQVYSEFRTGSKFKDEETDAKGFLHRTLGQNGLGAAATCLTSDEFKVTVRHYNSKKEQTITFIDGALKTKKGKAKTFKGHSGVKITLTLSNEVYKNNVVDSELLKKRIIDLAYNNPGLAFYFNKEKFHYQKGLFELAQRIDSEHAEHIGDSEYIYETVNAKKKKVKGKIDLSLSTTMLLGSEERERFISFVNSTPTYDGGFHHDRIRRLFINKIKDKLERAAKKEKVQITDNDVLMGVTFILGITMPNPRFESQTKRKLVRDTHLEKAIEEFVTKNMDKFMRKNKDYLEVVLERAKSRHKFQVLKEAAKTARKSKRQRVEKLLDANERKKRNLCTLFICEGDSAIGGLRSARNKLYQGGISLKGKPMNVAQAGIKDILNNQEFTDIMASIGLGIGIDIEPEKLRYSNIVFLADSDVDGGHINTLLTNFFYQFFPELFDMGSIQIAKAPLFEVVTNKKTHYFESDKELEVFRETTDENIKVIHRNKGLGEMSPEAWKYVLSKDEYTKITAEDAAKAKEMLHICFGKDTNLRKELLMDSDDEYSDVKTGKTDTEKASSSTRQSGDSSIAKKPAKKATKKVVKKAKKVAKKTAKKAAKKVAKKAAKKVAKSAAKKKAKKIAKKASGAAKKIAKKKATRKKASAKKKSAGRLADMIDYLD